MMGDSSPLGGFPAADSGPGGGHDWDTAARIARLLDVVQRYATLDFSESAPVGATGDDLDALAAWRQHAR